VTPKGRPGSTWSSSCTREATAALSTETSSRIQERSLGSQRRLLVATFEGDTKVRTEPFHAVLLDPNAPWAR
jgi:hypothetical protein